MTQANFSDPQDAGVIVIGAGPAGLTAAQALIDAGMRPLVLEQDKIVGGIARTETYRGYRFDMGGHRFFTKSPEVQALWHRTLGGEFLRRPRMSRIFYNGRYFDYPLKPMNALRGMGPIEAAKILLSYVRWQLFPYAEERTFAQWVTNRFGHRLFRTFFKSYTEKVWGISTDELGADWAAQRIKNLSLLSAVTSMLVKPGTKVTSLIEAFDYPRFGPGMMWETVQNAVERQGGEVRLEAGVTRVAREGMRVTGVGTTGPDGRETHLEARDVISSMPITEFIAKLDPPAPVEVRDAAAKLTYRDFLTVGLIIDAPELFPDNWIYIHDPKVKVGRIQNFKNWSPDMVPDATKTSLGLEYFCNEGDDLWTMPDEALVALATREVEALGLAPAGSVRDGCVFRVPKSYPVYDSGYKDALATVRNYVDGFENFQTVGRNGLHRYNNQDHAMLTGLYAVHNLLAGEQIHDLWDINVDQDYHEEAARETHAEPEQQIATGNAMAGAR